jgi:hypothetical protein
MLWRLAAVELIAAALLCDVVQAGGSQSRQKFTPHRRIADFGISTTIFYACYEDHKNRTVCPNGGTNGGGESKGGGWGLTGGGGGGGWYITATGRPMRPL